MIGGRTKYKEKLIEKTNEETDNQFIFYNVEKISAANRNTSNFKFK